MFLCERVVENAEDKSNENSNFHKVRLYSLDVLIKDDFDWNTLHPVDETLFHLVQENEDENYLPALPETQLPQSSTLVLLKLLMASH